MKNLHNLERKKYFITNIYIQSNSDPAQQEALCPEINSLIEGIFTILKLYYYYEIIQKWCASGFRSNLIY